MAIDTTIDVANQELQGGSQWEVSGILDVDVTNGGQFQLDSVQQPLKVTFSPAAGSANVDLTTIQVTDGAGNNLTYPIEMTVYLSDSSAGTGITATTASGAVAAGASGTDLGDLTSKKVKVVQTDATGKYILSITDTGKTSFYVCAYVGAQAKPFVSAQLVAANYG